MPFKMHEKWIYCSVITLILMTPICWAEAGSGVNMSNEGSNQNKTSTTGNKENIKTDKESNPKNALLSDEEKISALFTEWTALVNATAWQERKHKVNPLTTEDIKRLVSKDSIEAYEKFRYLSLYGEMEELDQLTLFNQLQVLLLRVLAGKDEMLSMTPEDTLIYALKEKFIEIDIKTKDKVKDITFNNQHAQAKTFIEFTNSNKELEHRENLAMRHFVKDESGNWKINLLPELEIMDNYLDVVVKSKNRAKAEVALAMLELRSARKILPSVFDPLLPKPSASESKVNISSRKDNNTSAKKSEVN